MEGGGGGATRAASLAGVARPVRTEGRSALRGKASRAALPFAPSPTPSPRRPPPCQDDVSSRAIRRFTRDMTPRTASKRRAKAGGHRPHPFAATSRNGGGVEESAGYSSARARRHRGCSEGRGHLCPSPPPSPSLSSTESGISETTLSRVSQLVRAPPPPRTCPSASPREDGGHCRRPLPPPPRYPTPLSAKA